VWGVIKVFFFFSLSFSFLFFFYFDSSFLYFSCFKRRMKLLLRGYFIVTTSVCEASKEKRKKSHPFLFFLFLF